jgi:hypothetical protein
MFLFNAKYFDEIIFSSWVIFDNVIQSEQQENKSIVLHHPLPHRNVSPSLIVHTYTRHTQSSLWLPTSQKPIINQLIIN